jgi:hypothetical protein
MDGTVSFVVTLMQLSLPCKEIPMSTSGSVKQWENEMMATIKKNWPVTAVLLCCVELAQTLINVVRWTVKVVVPSVFNVVYVEEE